MFPVWRPVKRLSTSLDRLKRRRLWIHERCTGQRKRFATTSQPFCEMQGRNLLHIATWERLSCSLFTQFVVFFDRLSSDGIGLTPPSPTFVKVYFKTTTLRRQWKPVVSSTSGSLGLIDARSDLPFRTAFCQNLLRLTRVLETFCVSCVEKKKSRRFFSWCSKKRSESFWTDYERLWK